MQRTQSSRSLKCWVVRGFAYTADMALYEFKCKECDTRFEVRRSMTDTSAVPCPGGHVNTVKLLSAFASVGASGATSSPAPTAAPARGCGGGCACH